MISHLLKQERGGVIVRVIFWTSFLGVLGALFFPISFGGRHGGRSSASRVKADLRSLATAIESYYVDNGSYPAWSANLKDNAFLESKSIAKAGLDGVLPSFRLKRSSDDALMTLTTPVSYLTSYFREVYGDARPMSFPYWRNEIPDDIPEGEIGPSAGWIAWSAGPDGDYDLTLENIERAYDPDGRVPNEYLIDCCTYDPTNGSTSNGDIYRMKQ